MKIRYFKIAPEYEPCSEYVTYSIWELRGDGMERRIYYSIREDEMTKESAHCKWHYPDIDSEPTLLTLAKPNGNYNNLAIEITKEEAFLEMI